MLNYYNEIDPFAAQWLRNLIDAELIPYGVVDTRDIRDVQPSDLAGFTQCHFFAGIGGWSYALNLAGVPASVPLWTGSCPCQPFSAAGKRGGFADDRHLWPEWFRLIRQCKPATIFGEQVASPDGLRWFDLVSVDLEEAGYAVGAADLCAASVGAPHIRQRLWFVADAECIGQERQTSIGELERRRFSLYSKESSPMVNAASEQVGLSGRAWEPGSAAGGMGQPDRARSFARREAATPMGHGSPAFATSCNPWSDLEWLPCIDGKWRPTKPGLQPILDGFSRLLAGLRAIETFAWKEIETYGHASNTNTDEVLRVVRKAIRAQESRKRQSTGMCEQLHASSLLLDFLFCLEAARNGTPDRSGFEKTDNETRYRILRGVRSHKSSYHSPCGRESDEQQSEQPTDALLSLSFILACHAAAYRKAARKANAASNRAGTLKGYGNAIVPQVAAEFIQNYLLTVRL